MKEFYKIVLVDDEDEVRGRISSKIDESSGFIVVGTASNGYDALDLIEKYNPDVVITDIKMPFIDGIELTKILKREYPAIKIAFISGYDEFDYAREAIELDVVSYLMKPVTKDDIDVFLMKLKKKLDDDYDRLFNEEKLKKDYLSSVPILIENQLNSFLRIRELSDEDINKLQIYGIVINDADYLIGLIEFDENNEFSELLKLRIFLKNLISSTFESLEFAYSFSTMEGLAFVLKNSVLNARDLENTFTEFIIKKNEYLDITIKVGLSSVFTDFKMFSQKYSEASTSLSSSRFINSGEIVFFSDIAKSETKDVVLSLEDIKDIEYVFRFGNDVKIDELITRLSSESYLNDGFLIHHQYYIISIANIILEYAASLNVNIRDILHEDFISKLFSYTDVSSMLEYTKGIVLKLREVNLKSSISRTKEIIDQVVKYIETKYADPSISLETVSDEYKISVSYLSMLLKKEKDLKFNKYLIKVRMEKAMELLRYSNSKVSDVAHQVGYNEVYYFSHSFKKYTGMSPKEYRLNEKTE